MWGKPINPFKNGKPLHLPRKPTQKDRLQYETLDLRLLEPLNRLRSTPPRDPRAVDASRLKFMEQLEQEFPSGEQPFGARALLGKIDLFRIRALTRPVFTIALLVLLAATFLFGGASLTARASQSALPGEPLYTFKTALEQTRLRLAGGVAQQAGLDLRFAATRLDEMERLTQVGRYADALAAAAEFRAYLENAYNAVSQLEQLNPQQAARLSSELSSHLSSFSLQLSRIASHLPAEYQNQLQAELPFPIEISPDQKPDKSAPPPIPTVDNQ